MLWHGRLPAARRAASIRCPLASLYTGGLGARADPWEGVLQATSDRPGDSMQRFFDRAKSPRVIDLQRFPSSPDGLRQTPGPVIKRARAHLDSVMEAGPAAPTG